MIIIVAYLLVMASVPLCGGRLSRLSTIRVRRVGTIVAAMALQIFIVNIVEGSISHDVASALHLASYGLALWFVQANWRVPGVPVIVTGGLMNLAAIAANGGVMPASPWAVRAAGRSLEGAAFQNSAATADARLWFLGDVLAWPAPLPLANVFSVGDIVIIVGAGVLLHVVGASSLAPRARRRLAVHEAAAAADADEALTG